MRGVAEVSATLVFFLYASSDLSARKTESPPYPTGEGYGSESARFHIEQHCKFALAIWGGDMFHHKPSPAGEGGFQIPKRI
jgi:hypothetical protein